MQIHNTISIIITNYNYGNYLIKSIESVAALVLPENFKIEILIGDDNSSDNSLDIIDGIEKQYSHLFYHFRVVFNKCNKGKNNLLNQLIPLATGYYSIILDSDDELASNYIIEMIKFWKSIEEESDITFTYSDCLLINASGEKIGVGKSCVFSKALVETHSYIPETALILSDVLKSALPLNENIKTGTKHHKWKKICIDNDYIGAYINKPLFNYRMHEKNISSIGIKIMGEGANNTKERLLHGYWPTSC